MSVALDKDVLLQFNNVGIILLLAFYGKRSIIKTGLFLDKHWQFIGCDSNVDCVQSFMQTFVDVYASQQLANNSDCICDGGLKASVPAHKLSKILC